MNEEAVLNPKILRNTGKPFTFIWENIHYEVETNKKKDKIPIRKTIINNVTGYANSGEVTAIMGPSGCGKTSLLNFLTDRIQFDGKATHSGKIFVNSEELESSKVASFSSYVMQDDLLFDILTPKETLIFVAKLRKKRTEEEYEKIVNELIEDLKLTKCMDTRIGNENTKGLSGGERKRTSIGVEIISNPTILFLDEPTSGLDSQTSFIVIDFLKELAVSKNKVIVFTIHQPSSNIFHLFDKLILMNKGEQVYQGPTMAVINFFENVGFPLGEKANPADAFMHKMEEQNARFERKIKKIATKVGEEEGKYEKEESLMDNYNTLIKPNIESHIKNIIDNSEKFEIPTKNQESTGFWNEFFLLSKRAFLNLIRNPMTLRLRCAMVLIFSFLACSIFYGMSNSLGGIYNKTGFMFFFTVNNFMTLIFSAVMTIPLERGVFLREYAGKMYGVAPYYLSKNLIETPIGLFVTFLYGIIVYYIVGLRSDGAQYYFTFLCIFICLSWLAQSMGLCFGASFSNVNTAMIITQFSVLPCFLFSGLLINQANMPAWLAWIRFFSPFRYSLEASLRNEFDNNPNVPQQYSPVNTLNLDIGMWNCVGIMVAYGFGLRVLGGLFLKLLVRKVG